VEIIAPHHGQRVNEGCEVVIEYVVHGVWIPEEGVTRLYANDHFVREFRESKVRISVDSLPKGTHFFDIDVVDSLGAIVTQNSTEVEVARRRNML